MHTDQFPPNNPPGLSPPSNRQQPPQEQSRQGEDAGSRHHRWFGGVANQEMTTHQEAVGPPIRNNILDNIRHDIEQLTITTAEDTAAEILKSKSSMQDTTSIPVSGEFNQPSVQEPVIGSGSDQPHSHQQPHTATPHTARLGTQVTKEECNRLLHSEEAKLNPYESYMRSRFLQHRQSMMLQHEAFKV